LTEDQVARVYEYFDWYRRWDGNEPEVAAKAERWKRLAIIWCDRAKEAEKERDSLLRQRAYLVKQRDDLLTFTEPEPEEAKSAAG
jgi:hypothetical protein